MTITARLHGRLGNQMFQYAAARALAARRGTDVALDTRTAEAKADGDLRRVFDLPVAEAVDLPPDKRARPLAYAWARMTSRTYKREDGLGYDPTFPLWPDGSYLHGYWQSERYFEDIVAQIRAAFTFRTPPSAANAEMAARIASGPSVSLHVRRGDYVDTGAMAVCDQGYYDAALAAVTKGMARPTVYVFSDDPDWARDNLEVPFDKVVVDLNGPEGDFEDLRLMGLCDANVIANSSFSWWGAWLGEGPQSRIAGPKQWFAPGKPQNPDILPKRWIAI
ncbi:MAG: alpha-1,2-fucosyltransferase [Pseudomonadota bacterium]